MNLYVVGLSRAEILEAQDYFSLHQPSEQNIVLLSVVRPTEPNDHAALCSKFGNHFIFLLLNDYALKAYVPRRRIVVLGTIEQTELKDRQSTLVTGRLLQPKSSAAR